MPGSGTCDGRLEVEGRIRTARDSSAVDVHCKRGGGRTTGTPGGALGGPRRWPRRRCSSPSSALRRTPWEEQSSSAPGERREIGRRFVGEEPRSVAGWAGGAQIHRWLGAGWPERARWKEVGQGDEDRGRSGAGRKCGATARGRSHGEGGAGKEEVRWDGRGPG